jgi:hypothetical protein
MRPLASCSECYIFYGRKFKLSRRDSIIESRGRKLIKFNVKFISVNCIVNNFFITIVQYAKFLEENMDLLYSEGYTTS